MTTPNELDQQDSNGLMWLDRTDVDEEVGAARVDAMCNDSGGVTADESILNGRLAAAETMACSILLRAYSLDEIIVLMNQDKRARSASAVIAAELMSRRKGDFASDDGKGRYYQGYKEALEYLTKVSHGGTETVAKGVTNVQEGGTIAPRALPPEPAFIFAPEKTFRGPGGRGGF